MSVESPKGPDEVPLRIRLIAATSASSLVAKMLACGSAGTVRVVFLGYGLFGTGGGYKVFVMWVMVVSVFKATGREWSSR